MFFTDSGRSGVHDIIDKINLMGDYIEVVVHKSGTFAELISSAEDHLNTHHLHCGRSNR